MHLADNIALLIEKYLNGTLSTDERALLDQWYNSAADDKAALLPGSKDEQEINERLQRRIFNTIHTRRVFFRKWQRLLVASSVLLMLISTAVYYYIQPTDTALTPTGTALLPASTDLVPGGNRALLTLADGSTIILDSAANGTISRQGNIKVMKLDNGLVSYTGQRAKKDTNKKEIVYNTISTPRGGQYQITLSDGTKVWLNAASSIRFPVAFTGTERSVAVTGEAYFEVAHHKQMPFKVLVNNNEIEVLGTHFNINAYDDEATLKTTLLEGKIKQTVNGGAAQKILLPGQQSEVGRDGKMIVKENADTEEAIAWMRGNFQFKSADLHSILRQVARWYDAEIEYNGNINLHFTGQLPRSENVTALFKNLALTGEVHFRIEGRKIIVSPS
jgi:ferric-dicitrate binding protein FerR (iron transport regulator)